MSGFPAREVKLMKARSKGVCEGCGVAEAAESHHRQYRSRGGPDTAVNGLRLCGWGNHTGCHGRAHTKAGEADGWAIRSGFDPAEVPALIVVDFVQSWWRLLADGTREPVNTPDAIEFMTLIHARGTNQ